MSDPLCRIERTPDVLELIDLPYTSLVLLRLNPGEGIILLGDEERRELMAALEVVEQEAETDGE